MNAMPMIFSATTALMTAAMMVAMMLPSLAAALWRHHRRLGAMPIPGAAARTTIFAAGYAGVWTAIGLLLFAMSAAPSLLGLEAAANAPLPPLAAGAVVLFAGVLQSSRWKARQLARCRVPAVGSTSVMMAWRSGCRFGIDCMLSCAAPMAVLLTAGLMNTHMMLVITAAITAERVMPAGARVARLTGTIALVAGTIMCLRAIGGRGFVLAIDASAVAGPRVYAIAPTPIRGMQSEYRPAFSLHRRTAA